MTRAEYLNFRKWQIKMELNSRYGSNPAVEFVHTKKLYAELKEINDELRGLV